MRGRFPMNGRLFPHTRGALRASAILLALVFLVPQIPAAQTIETFDASSCQTPSRCWKDHNAQRITTGNDPCIFMPDAGNFLRTTYTGAASYSHHVFRGSADAGHFSVQFFDDLGICDAPFFPAKTQMALIFGNDSLAYGLGVMNPGNKPRTYTAMVAGGLHDTELQRTYGWHTFSFTWAFDELVMSIDGVPVLDVFHMDDPGQALVGDLWGGAGPGRGAGWWDNAVVAV